MFFSPWLTLLINARGSQLFFSVFQYAYCCLVTWDRMGSNFGCHDAQWCCYRAQVDLNQIQPHVQQALDWKWGMQKKPLGIIGFMSWKVIPYCTQLLTTKISKNVRGFWVDWVDWSCCSHLKIQQRATQPPVSSQSRMESLKSDESMKQWNEGIVDSWNGWSVGHFFCFMSFDLVLCIVLLFLWKLSLFCLIVDVPVHSIWDSS